MNRLIAMFMLLATWGWTQDPVRVTDVSDTFRSTKDSGVTVDDDNDMDGINDIDINGTITAPSGAWHTAVTLSGSPDYLTISSQVITRGTIDISDDTNLGKTGSPDYVALTGDNIVVGTVDVSDDTNLSVGGSFDYISLVGDAITTAQVDIGDDTNLAVGGTPDYVTLVGDTITLGTVDIGDDTNLAVGGTPNYITLVGDTLTLATVDIGDDTNLAGGTSLTLSGDTLNVDDDFVKVAGDVMSGSLEINASGALILDDASATLDIESNLTRQIIMDRTENASHNNTFYIGVGTHTGTTNEYWYVAHSTVTADRIFKVMENDQVYISDITSPSPETDALLELESVNKAFIVTRMTTTQRDAMTAANGMIIYNTTDSVLQGYTGGSWSNL